MKTHLPALLALAALAAAPAAAQTMHPSKPTDGKVTPLINAADSAEIYRIFSEIAPKAPNIPNAPQFAIVGKNKKFYLGIGGTVKAVMMYDWPDPIENTYEFATSAINMHPEKGNNGRIGFSANQSSLFLTLAALPGTRDQIGVYTMMNFVTPNYTPSLAYAYVTWRGLTAGYNYSLFSDMGAAVPTIDYEGPNSWTAIPNVVVDYEKQFGSHWGVGVGLERPQASYTTAAGSRWVYQRVPDIPMYVQYSWGGGSSWVRLSGMVRNIFYRDRIADRNRDAVGWGVKASGAAKVTKKFIAYYQVAYGRGLTSYFEDLNGGGLDLVPKSGAPGELEPVEAWGGYLGLQYYWTPKVYSDIAYSHLRNYAKPYANAGAETAWSEQYRYAQYGVANIFWNINPMLQAGVEYLYGRRVDMSGLSHHDNRLQCCFQVSF